MKAQIALCVLIVSGTSLFADEMPFSSPLPPASTPFVQTAGYAPDTAQGMPVDAQGSTGIQMASYAGPADTFTAPPMVIGPDGQPMTTQYPPPAGATPEMMAPPGTAPGMAAPGMTGPPMAPYGNPMASPFGMSPGGIVDPGLVEPIFPYKALTPDVTMVPTTPNGPMPNRFGGWTQLYDMGAMPFTGTKNDAGKFGEMEFNLAWKYIAPLYPAPAIFSFTQQYGLRLFSGPSSADWVPPTNLPGSLHRIGWDFELKSNLPGPWNAVIAFNPSINSDFVQSPTHNAWNWDGRAAMLYSPTRELTYVLGILAWDRLSERILPWAGVIYRPNQYWQYDLVFPQFRVSAYLWDEWGFRTSIYGRVEYHSEAYEMWNPVVSERDRVQFTDWRALIGFNKDMGTMAYFVEAGWIFGRNINYKVAPQGFDINSGAIVRGGVRF